MNDAPHSPASSMVTFRKVLGVVGSYAHLLLLSVLLAGLTVVLQLYIPVLFGDAIDQIVESKKNINVTVKDRRR